MKSQTVLAAMIALSGTISFAGDRPPAESVSGQPNLPYAAPSFAAPMDSSCHKDSKSLAWMKSANQRWQHTVSDATEELRDQRNMFQALWLGLRLAGMALDEQTGAIIKTSTPEIKPGEQMTTYNRILSTNRTMALASFQIALENPEFWKGPLAEDDCVQKTVISLLTETVSQCQVFGSKYCDTVHLRGLSDFVAQLKADHPKAADSLEMVSLEIRMVGPDSAALVDRY